MRVDCKLMIIVGLALALPVLAADSHAPAIKQFLGSYCIDCHGAKKQKGDRRFDQLTYDLGDPVQGEHLAEILDALNLGEMPPEDEKQASNDELLRMIGLLTGTLAEAQEQAREHTGKVVMRRMNRVEYRNAIRDLFSIDVSYFDPTLGFPDDAATDGFDNVGEGLVMSEFLLREALRSADSITNRVINPGPPPKPVQLHNKASGNMLGHDALHSFIIKGSYTVKRGKRTWYAPAEGTYSIRIKTAMLRRLDSGITAGHLRYKNETPARISLTARSSANGVPSTQHIGWYDVPDNEATDIHIRTHLRKGSILMVNWPGGPNTSIKKIMRKTLPKYYKADTVSLARNPQEMFIGAVPTLKIYDFELAGPHFDQWPRPGFAEYFGEVPEKTPTVDDLRNCLTKLATRAFRRPVSADENLAYLRVAEAELATSKNFWQAVRVGVRTILISPEFLYLVEPGTPDGKPAQLSGEELATRLSFFAWSAPPDIQLTAAAAAGKLKSGGALLAELERLLKDDRAAALTENFLGQWLWLRTLGDMPPSYKKDPIYYRNKLETAMHEETRLFFADLLENNGSVMNLAESDYGFINDGLAELYKIEGVEGPEFRRVTFTKESQRGGLLGQASVLTVTGNGVESLPVTRGLYVLENLLGIHPPPPPPDVPEIPPDTGKATSIREKLDLHRQDATCFECHRKLDPFGLALERFDYLGRYRYNYGKAFRKKGVENTIEVGVEAPDGTAFEDLSGLKAYIASDPDRFTRCLTEKLMTYALGRRLAFTDRETVDAIVAKSAKSGRGLRDLLKLIVTSEAFRSK
jgi:hypothetical protein